MRVNRTIVTITAIAAVAEARKPASSSPFSAWRLPGQPFDDLDDNSDSSWKGSGREFEMFGSRSGQEGSSLPDGSRSLPPFPTRPASSTTRTPTTQRPRSYASYGGRTSRSRGSQTTGTPVFQSVREWWSEHVKHWPKLQCRVEPTTTLKIRKTFRPLKTIVQFGADFNTQLGVWQFKSSWEDAIIGGKLTLAGRELQLTKSWQLSVGSLDDLVTRLRLRAAVDLGTMKAYARVGFRTERLSPINMAEGFTIQKQLPLDGTDGHVKLEVKANFALPEPEIEYSTESHRSLIGMGDMEVNIEELNLILDY